MQTQSRIALDGKVAVITGAASGIGRATLERFVACGARVLAADVQREAGRELEAAHPGAVTFVQCDVSDTRALRAAIDAAADRFGGLDVLFANAGRLGARGGVEAFDEVAWDDTFALLVRSVAAATAFAVPHMKRRGGGSIVITASIAATQAGYGPLAYSAAKAGVLHYARLAAAELAPHRIRVNSVLPGYIATPIFGQVYGMDPQASDRMADAVAAGSGSANPVGRAGTPDDVAEAVLWLASEAAGFVTGAQLTVDGGITVGPRHAWDRATPGPLADTLGEARARLRAQPPNPDTP